jgi:SAM-dependent methyltransferase
MATLTENKKFWGQDYDWPTAGDEWSELWGSSEAQWSGALLPRIFPFLNGRILEIAPGHGRWTQFLAERCDSLIAVDLAPSCVEHCRKRFAGRPRVEFHANDGLTFPMVASESIDFAFSFDSLVHAEAEVVSSYVKELARVLKPGASAFLHHSNLGGIHRTVWDKVKRRISGLPYHQYWRAMSMSAVRMRKFAELAGMSCVQQELVPWGTGWPLLIDCMTTIVNRPGVSCVVIENHRFMDEATAIKRISRSAEGMERASSATAGSSHS